MWVWARQRKRGSEHVLAESHAAARDVGQEVPGEQLVRSTLAKQ